MNEQELIAKAESLAGVKNLDDFCIDGADVESCVFLLNEDVVKAWDNLPKSARAVALLCAHEAYLDWVNA